MYSRSGTTTSTKSCSEQIEKLKYEIKTADAIVIGAGAGLSASAGFTYTGERFEKFFGDFIEKYGLSDMYSGGFYPFETLEEHWAYWSRYIYINRYMDAPKPIYNELLRLVDGKDYFVLTTNVDHCFQKAGFDKSRLFYTQGDYGLWQCSKACHDKTYDNEDVVRQMVAEQKDMKIPTELVPKCPVCGAPMTMNLRCDNSFVQDDGWYAASNRYDEFILCHKELHILFLELGVGANTPVIIKYPFWKMTAKNPQAVYVCINKQEAYAPREIVDSALCIESDISEILKDIVSD